jgi:Na+/H+ antiporter NhaA
MWYFTKHSGVHATLTGVLLAFAIPFRSSKKASPSYILQNIPHKPVAYIILPLVALANSSFTPGENWQHNLGQLSTVGILLGLIIGKPLDFYVFKIRIFTWSYINNLRLKVETHYWRWIFGRNRFYHVNFHRPSCIQRTGHDQFFQN